MNDNRNLFAAIALSAIVLFGWQFFVAKPQMEQQQKQQHTAQQQTKAETPEQIVAPPTAAPPLTTHLPRSLALKQAAPASSLRLDGGRIDPLKGRALDDLNSRTIARRSIPRARNRSARAVRIRISLFRAIRLEFDQPETGAPNERTPWALKNGNVLSPGHPVTLTWTTARA